MRNIGSHSWIPARRVSRVNVSIDAMAHYQINKAVAVQVNGYNLANKYYYTNSYFSSPVENHVVPGQGRYALLTLTLGF